MFLCENKHDPDFRVAAKVINKFKLNDTISSIKEEIAILKKVDHVNIVKHYETYEDFKYVYVVMEYCDGGELFDEIINKENQLFTESEAVTIMGKLLRAINHCHAQGIVHRDIKPENILISRKDGELKLVDFGLAKIFENQKKRKMTSMVGTPFYMAPEVLDHRYTSKCDIWSLGVLMYVLLSGYLPFQGEKRADVFLKIKEGKFHFNHIEFKCVSKEAKTLICKMLDVNEKTRISAEEALKDPWFQKFKNLEKGSKEDILDPLILESL